MRVVFRPSSWLTGDEAEIVAAEALRGARLGGSLKPEVRGGETQTGQDLKGHEDVVALGFG